MKKRQMRIFDSRIVPPFLGATPISSQFAHEGRKYGELYFGRSDQEAFRRDSSILTGDNIWEASSRLMQGADAADHLVRILDDTGIQRALFCGFDNTSTRGRVLDNQVVAEMQRKHPDRFTVLAGVDPYKGVEAVREFEHAIRELGLKGLRIVPFELEMYPNDRRLYPLYEKCVELDVIMESHSSVNFTQSRLMEYAHPKYLDEVACDFPELKIIADHAGWPWINEIVAQAWRHYNFYICISSIRPKYLGTANSGWEMLLHYGNTVIQDKILWASTWPFLPIKRGIEETLALPLKDEVKEKWFFRNAARLFGVEEEFGVAPS
jgi:predicted TIM-barrel fold metal-dependent hydrolase